MADPPASHRARMMAHSYADLGAALAAGELWAARIAHETIGRLLAAAEPGDGAPVVDLAAERRKRGER